MNRKFLIFALIAVFAVVSLGIVFAGDDDTFKVSGVEFHVPDGYHITNKSTSMVFLEDNNGQSCSIEVSSGALADNKVNGNEESVGGKTGVCRDLTSPSSGKSSFSFMYTEDSHFIKIRAPDRSTVEAIID